MLNIFSWCLKDNTHYLTWKYDKLEQLIYVRVKSICCFYFNRDWGKESEWSVSNFFYVYVKTNALFDFFLLFLNSILLSSWVISQNQFPCFKGTIPPVTHRVTVRIKWDNVSRNKNSICMTPLSSYLALSCLFKYESLFTHHL